MELSKIWLTHKRLIIILGCALAFALLSVVSCLSILAAQPKQVTLTLNGTTQTYQSGAETVGEFLAERKIPVSAKDTLIPASTTPLKDAQSIYLHTSWEVSVLVDGKEKQVQTLSRNVAGALKDAGITLSQFDKVEPSLTAALTEGAKISVNRVAETIVQVEENVPFQEIRKNDPSLKKGETRVLHSGQPGKALLHYKVVLENGKEISRELVKREVLTAKNDRIVAVGTAQAVTAATNKSSVIAAALVSRGGKIFRPNKVLESVSLTAYTAAGGGKSPKSAGYGRTATGIKAEEGRTIAVDPRVIPLGWWVYIDGIGYRRAEDTGGAVRGHKIDVFFTSHSDAVRFGRKRNKTVYVIGPHKP